MDFSDENEQVLILYHFHHSVSAQKALRSQKLLLVTSTNLENYPEVVCLVSNYSFEHQICMIQEKGHIKWFSKNSREVTAATGSFTMVMHLYIKPPRKSSSMVILL